MAVDNIFSHKILRELKFDFAMISILGLAFFIFLIFLGNNDCRLLSVHKIFSSITSEYFFLFSSLNNLIPSVKSFIIDMLVNIGISL